MPLVALLVMCAIWFAGVATMWVIDPGLCLAALGLVIAGIVWGSDE